LASSSEPPRPSEGAGSEEVLAPSTPFQTGDGQTGEPSTPLPWEPRPGRWRRALGWAPAWLIVLTLVVVIAAPVGYLVHIPYYSVGPGPSVDVLTLIDVRGGAKTYSSRGKLLLTTVSESVNTVNLWDALYAWIDPGITLIPQRDVLLPGQTSREANLENQLEMDESKFAAEVAAFRALGLTVAQIPGARVVAVSEGFPAFGHLRAHDLIVSVDGTRVTSPAGAVQLLSKHKIGSSVKIGFKRGTKLMSVTLKSVASATKPPHALIGVSLLPAFQIPRDVQIDTQNIVGPSGGMIFALAIYDAFTPADLTGGHIIAGTGEIGFDAKGRAIIGDIGGIEEKVRTAQSHGADIFLAPADQAAAARKVAPKSMKVIGVHTFAEALTVLKALQPVKSAA
jgi:PDZ domain-containing protein